MDVGRYAKLFLSESRENLSEMNNALLELERGGSDAAIDRLFRAVHTMKGMGVRDGIHSGERAIPRAGDTSRQAQKRLAWP